MSAVSVCPSSLPFQPPFRLLEWPFDVGYALRGGMRLQVVASPSTSMGSIVVVSIRPSIMDEGVSVHTYSR